jgi:hypothetical protein
MSAPLPVVPCSILAEGENEQDGDVPRPDAA